MNSLQYLSNSWEFLQSKHCLGIFDTYYYIHLLMQAKSCRRRMVEAGAGHRLAAVCLDPSFDNSTSAAAAALWLEVGETEEGKDPAAGWWTCMNEKDSIARVWMTFCSYSIHSYTIQSSHPEHAIQDLQLLPLLLLNSPSLPFSSWPNRRMVPSHKQRMLVV